MMDHQLSNEWLSSSTRRTLDVMGAVTLLPVAVPASALISGTIIAKDHMHPHYQSLRLGTNGYFILHKLRTMPPGTAETPSFGSESDPRSTLLGRTLRKTHLDEMPQLINIVNGTMSMIGPRPLLKIDVDEVLSTLSLKRKQIWLASRSLAKPGITGPWQLRQHYSNYDSSVKSDLVELDIDFAKKWTPDDDIACLLQSAKTSLESIINITGSGSEKGHFAADTLAAVAKAMNIDIDDTQLNWWRAMFASTRVVDDLIDNGGVKNPKPYLDLMASGARVGTMTDREASHFANTYDNVSDEKRKKVEETFSHVARISSQRKCIRTVDQLREICFEEAELFASLFYLESDNEMRIRFNNWLRQYMTVGYLIDSAIDMYDDYVTNVSSVSPSFKNRLALFTAIPDAISLDRNTVPARTGIRLARQALRTLLH